MMKSLMSSLAILGATITLAGCFSYTKEKTTEPAPAVVEAPPQSSSTTTTTTTVAPQP